jgi:hypothetical protein
LPLTSISRAVTETKHSWSSSDLADKFQLAPIADKTISPATTQILLLLVSGITDIKNRSGLDDDFFTLSV